ncbi:MAG: outer membrane beta-barrel protein [Candidatus Eisenbacteria bacterium]|jgi:opacity protein-like surface antigen|nr:outer membrane beta-barrel protein [Candidatus Eisenbacteria bacterium]MBP8137070.1 outer membrane beta-barrel protein [Candidatus Eisenbacteria bacterium]
MRRAPLLSIACFAVLALAAAVPAQAAKVEGFFLKMDPYSDVSRQYGRPGYGGGLEVVGELPGTAKLFAGVGGLEIVNMLSTTTEFRDVTTGLRIEQQTTQNYGRLYLGGQFGSHSSGFLRPYVGANVAMVWYGISTDVVVPDDRDRENEIRQNLRDENELAFGWDANAGVDFNVRDKWSIDVGVRYLHSYDVPQQLGAGSVRIEPDYFQLKIGVGFNPSRL